MPKVVYVQRNGTEHVVDIDSGISVMRAAVDNSIPGIDGDCGGQCACATCHVYVDETWLDKVGNPTDSEEGMLSTVVYRRPNSRLSCQIKMGEELDGLLVKLPSSQH